jgi:hypothetical protein
MIRGEQSSSIVGDHMATDRRRLQEFYLTTSSLLTDMRQDLCDNDVTHVQCRLSHCCHFGRDDHNHNPNPSAHFARLGNDELGSIALINGIFVNISLIF